FLDILRENISNSDEAQIIGKVITKLLNLEQQIVLEAYEQEHRKELGRQYEMIKEEVKEKISAVVDQLAHLSEQTKNHVSILTANSEQVYSTFQQSIEKSTQTQSLATAGQEKI